MDYQGQKSQREQQRLEQMAAYSRFEDPSMQIMRERWADEEAMEEAVEIEATEE